MPNTIVNRNNTLTHKFGTFQGVFLPSILTILGLIMYLRLGWLVANAGIIPLILIISLSSLITFLTSLSIAATATNMKIGVGGAYYMISRSFGLEAGAAIGIPLYLAQALGISFYVAGFSESIQLVFPDIESTYINVITLSILTTIALISARTALKIQFIVFLLIVSSLLAFFFGIIQLPTLPNPSIALSSFPISFWVAFAIFFPAVTGIEAGISMSGDLKSPSRSLPLGTLLSVGISYIIYLIIPILFVLKVPLEDLNHNTLIMKEVAIWGLPIILGIWGATLSSALGALLGAPRTLQALSKDKLMPSILSKGFSEDNTPRYGILFTFLIALGGTLIGNIDVIAPILTMFFLTSYGFLNLAAGLEGFLQNPSWRPSFQFKYSWALSLIGSILCFAVMFMINPGVTIIAITLCSGIFTLIKVKGLSSNWDDIRYSLLEYLARYSIYNITKSRNNARSWRPKLLVLSGSVQNRWHLIEFANKITSNRSFLTIASLISQATVDEHKISQLESIIREYLNKKQIQALVEVCNTQANINIFESAQQLIKYYGMGTLSPNTILLGGCRTPSNLEHYVDLLISTHSLQKNIIILSNNKEDPLTQNNNISVWLSKNKQNASLMLAFAHMLQQNTNAQLTLQSLVFKEEEKEGAQSYFTQFIKDSRIKATTKVTLCNNSDNIFPTLLNNSHKSDTIFLGMRSPSPSETKEEYLQYYKSLITELSSHSNFVLVLVAEPIDFEAIFL